MFLAASPTIARAQQFPEFPEFTSGHNPEDSGAYDHRGFCFYVDSVIRDEKSRAFVRGMSLVREAPGGKPRQYGPFSRGEWSVYYPRLYLGEILPMTGRLVGVNQLIPGPGSVTLKVLPKELVPEGVSPSPDSFCIPLRGSATLRSDVILVRDLVPDTITNSPTVEVIVTNVWDWKFDGFSGATKRLVFDKRKLFVRPDDLIFLGGRLYPVRRIIPRDPEWRVIG